MASKTQAKATSGTNNGFFGSIAQGIGSALGQTAQLLPIWASNELGLQNGNQMAAPTFNRRNAPPTLRGPISDTTTPGSDVTGGSFRGKPRRGTQTGGRTSIQDTSANTGGGRLMDTVDQLLGVQVGDVSLSGTTVLLIAGAAVAGIMLAR